PSSWRRRAMSSFSLEVGIVAVSCSALLALRILVSMSAMGSVSISAPFYSWKMRSIFHDFYQELFVMPGITPWWARSRRQMRQSPNFLKTARGRPHRVHREYARTLKRCGRAALAIIDFLAI